MKFCQWYFTKNETLKTKPFFSLDFENRYYMSNLVVELLTVLLLKKRLSKREETDIYGYF